MRQKISSSEAPTIGQRIRWKTIAFYVLPYSWQDFDLRWRNGEVKPHPLLLLTSIIKLSLLFTIHFQLMGFILLWRHYCTVTRSYHRWFTRGMDERQLGDTSEMEIKFWFLKTKMQKKCNLQVYLVEIIPANKVLFGCHRTILGHN